MAHTTALAAEYEVRVTYVDRNSTFWFQLMSVRQPASQPAGYARVVQHHRHVWIEEITVRPDCRGEGLASVLLKAVIERFGRREIGLLCYEYESYPAPRNSGLDHERLLAWYGRYGWKPDEYDECMWRPAD